MGDNLLRRTTIGAVLLLGSWGWSSAMVTIAITTDSASELSGSFSASSSSDSEGAFTTTFGLLPGILSTDQLLKLWRLDSETGSTRSLIFQTRIAGTPNDPSFSLSFPLPDFASRTFADLSGTYSNNPSSTPVYFMFSSLADSGGTAGSFSGNFAFSTSPLNPIPEPEIYAMMIAGLGLVGLMARRKRKQQEDAAS